MKNIVICCDGTANDVINDSTNVLRFYRTLERSERQIAYYDSGVGTLPDPTKLTGIGRRWSKKLDSAIGHSVRENVCKAYRFLARNYEPGDKIYLFGFSRGAYTVRALAGMIHFLGLVNLECVGLDQLAWSVFAAKEFVAGKRFKYSFSRTPPVEIHFVGVWDTVSAFGWFTSYRTVPYSANNPSVTHARHAVSIDEHRACFSDNLFRPKESTQHQSFKQLWFAGAHCDVGGGYSEEESGLAKIALEWMYREAKEQGCLLVPKQVEFFLGRADQKYKQTKPSTQGLAHNSTKGIWHFAEFVPRRQWDHNSSPERMRCFWPNIYRRRKIPQGAILHESVRKKMEEDSTYKPNNLPSEYEFAD